MSDKYRVIFEENTLILQFYEQRTKVKKDGSQVDFEFTENYYYPNLKTALKAFVNKSLNYCKTIDEVLVNIERLEKSLTN